ncbi:MAG: hypothetical protein C5B58_12055 [Acidobacteria bacterium]|nr:MAG: hypothetical protein C5B58_12055 [Acidobacteriota bacterium]
MLSNELRAAQNCGAVIRTQRLLLTTPFTATILLRQQTSDQSRCDGGHLTPKGGKQGLPAIADPIRSRNVMENCVTEF